MSQNAYARFAKLTSGQPLMLGTVTVVNPDGTVTVTLNGGGNVRVLGSGYAVSDPVYVRNGQVVGDAPDLTYYEVDV